MTSLIKSADVSKILTSDEIFLYFSRHVMLVYKRAKRHLLCCLINDFMEGGLNQPPPNQNCTQKPKRDRVKQSVIFLAWLVDTPSNRVGHQ